MLTVAFLLDLGAVRAILAPKRHRPAVSPAENIDVESFSVDRYRPMERLFQEQDFLFLASQPGFRRPLADRLRRERRRILRSYLCQLEEDFCRFYLAAMEHPSREVAAKLVRQKVKFGAAIVKIRLRLLLNLFALVSLEVAPAIESLRTVALTLAEINREHAVAE